ncbi:MAG: hypothetical protein HY744_01260 [Deltaproteobacteria bacterium]|nr:hypothetical protein [Deltaproteobacteria bacterium]
MRVARLLVMLVAACTPVAVSSPPPASLARASGGPQAEATKALPAPAAPVVEATAVGIRYGKPPLKEHRFDLVLRNPAVEPRWLLLPDVFPYAGEARPAPGLDPEVELQVYLLAEAPRVVIINGVGGNFWAVRLPGRGQVTLRGLAIRSWWDEVPPATRLQAIVAREIWVGGLPLAARIETDPMSETGADVAAPKDASDPRALRFWHPDGGGSAPVAIEAERRVWVTVSL